MWGEADVTVEADDDVMLAVITTPSESFES